MDWKSELVHGIYESVITHSLQEKIERLQDTFDIEQKSLDSDESHFSLALHLAKLIASTLASMKGDDKKSRQAQFCNQLNIINTDKVVSNFFKALKEHSVVNLEDVAFSVCTKRTVPNDFSGVAIIAYGSPDLMKAVQECSGDIDVILVPWLLEEGETWAHAYNAEVLE